MAKLCLGVTALDFKHWYAAFVMTGQEDKIVARISDSLAERKDAKVRLLVPKRSIRERKAGKVTEQIKVMFPGYVLIGTEQIDEVSRLIAEVKGVLRILKNDDEFQEIRLEEISRLVHMANDKGVIGESKIWLNENDRVEVISGPLKGYEGLITKLNRRKNRVAVNILLGTEHREVWLAAEFVDTPQDSKS